MCANNFKYFFFNQMFVFTFSQIFNIYKFFQIVWIDDWGVVGVGTPEPDGAPAFRVHQLHL